MSAEYENRVEKAVDLFMQGYGCCQSVTGAFADLYGVDDVLAKKIAAGFGGGVGRLRMMCGAVSGLVILAGMDCGQIKGDDREGKAQCYQLVQRLVKRFEEMNGSVICAELLGSNGVKPETNYVPSARTDEYYKKRPCVAKVECAARIFADYLEHKSQNN